MGVFPHLNRESKYCVDVTDVVKIGQFAVSFTSVDKNEQE